MKGIARRIRDAAFWLDQQSGTRIKPILGDVYRAGLRLLSRVRRHTDPVLIRLRYGIGLRPASPVRLHLGCGPKRLEGYLNVDLWITEATDVICNIHRLPWPDASVTAVESHHVIEHISHRRVRDTVREWNRVLVPDGELVVECPNFDETVREYLEGNEERLVSIFGRQRREGDVHLFGYNPSRLMRLLEEMGFSDFIRTNPRSHQSLEEPVMRIECRKKGPPAADD